jgi:uncharacterized membrane protein
MQQKSFALFIALVCLAYVVFRLWGLTESCLWFDEIFSIHAAELPLRGLLDLAAKDLIHPPLFYILLKLWILVGGETLFWLRLFPFFFSLLAIVPFLFICKELRLGRFATGTAMVLFAVNGSLIKYTQEVRMYSLLLFLSLLSLWLFTRFFFKGKNFLLLLLVNVLLVYTHYYGWFIIFSEVVAIAWFQRIKLGRIVVVTGVAAAAFLPWVVAVISAARSGSEISQNIGWIPRPGFSALFEFAVSIVEPFHFRLSSSDPITIPYASLPILAAIGIAKIWYFLKDKDEAERIRMSLLAIFCGVPVAFAFIASWIMPFSVWGNRHLIVVVPPMLLLAGVFLANASPQILRIGLTSVCAVALVIGFVVRVNAPEVNPNWCAWEEMAATEDLRTGDLNEKATLYVYEELVAYHFWFANRKRDDIEISVIKGIPGVVEDPAYFLPRGFSEVTVIDPGAISGRIVCIAFRTETPVADPANATLTGPFPKEVSILLSLGYRKTGQYLIKKDGAIAYLLRLELGNETPP